MLAGPADARTPASSVCADGANRSKSPARVLELDGVRGAAILLVFFYHVVRALPSGARHEGFLLGALSGGWVGVDLFFALSGFLITGILLDDAGTPRYFVRFYTRRVLRILPLYLSFVFFALHVLPALGLVWSEDVARFPAVEPWYWTHTVNFLIASSGWKSGAPYTKQLWSLGVEEQFYLLWPALVLFLARRDLRRLLFVMLAAAPLLRMVLTAAHASSTAIYVLLPTRMDTLAVGALLAVFARDPAAWERCRRFARPAMAGAVALLAAIVYRERGLGGEEKLTQMFGYSPIALLAGGAVLSALTASPRSLTGLVWRHPVLRMFGRYSYGMYVWHTFVIWRIHDSMFRDGRTAAVTGSSVAGDLLFVAVALAMTMAVSLASWYVVENPFLRLKRFVPGGRREGQASAWTLSTQPVVVHQNGLETP